MTVDVDVFVFVNVTVIECVLVEEAVTPRVKEDDLVELGVFAPVIVVVTEDVVVDDNVPV